MFHILAGAAGVWFIHTSYRWPSILHTAQIQQAKLWHGVS